MLRLQPQPWLDIIRHCEAGFPLESCGILLGSTRAGIGTVTLAFICRNAHPGDRTTRFLIDPADHCEAQRLARARSLEILGFFHSHPNRDAHFSATDRAEAWPGVSNLVVAIADGRFREARSFRSPRSGAPFEEEPLALPACHQTAPGGIKEVE